MPLLKGKSRRDQSQNFHELRHGPQFRRTSRNFGPEKAHAQMVAIVLKKAGKGRRRARLKR